MQFPEDLRYTESHEWVAVEADGTLRIGITEYAQDALGDVVYVELPEMGREVTAGEGMAEVESTKSVEDVYAPVTGVVIAVNDALADTPELVNQDPYDEGWFVRIRPEGAPDLGALMDAAAYEEFIG